MTPTPTVVRASPRDWAAVVSAMLAAFMAILDIQITNASLANIEGAVGASPSQGSWISTAYLIAEIITIPLTGWLGQVVGLKRYLIANSLLFLVFSLCCAWSDSLMTLILSRCGQGFCGGVLIPTAVTILRTRLPRTQQPIGISIFGLTATLAPALGPTLGGWLTDNLSWHYLFYINLLPGTVTLVMFAGALDPAPAHWRELKRGDWTGIVLMAAGLSSLTVVLEEGQRETWFGSDLIQTLSVLAALGIVGFVARELTTRGPLINLRLLGNRSVGSACLLMTVFGAVSLGSVYIIPLYCAQIQGYNPEQIGEVVMWSGLPQLAIFPLMPRLMRRFDPRLLVATGTLLFVASCFINTALTQDVGMQQLILPQVLRAIGQPLFAVPLSQLATAGLPPRDTADAAALSSMMRNLGGSLCIAMISTVVERREHFHFSMIAERLSANDLMVQQRVATLALRGQPVDVAVARLRAVARITLQVRQQATIMSYADAFGIIGVTLMACLLALVLLRRPAPRS